MEKHMSVKMSNANKYGSMAVIVTEIQNRKVDGKYIEFAVGVNANDPTEEVAVRLMTQERLRVHLAQFKAMAHEKAVGDGVIYTKPGSVKGANVPIEKDEYDKIINHPSINIEVKKYNANRANADTIKAKENRASLPTMMYFDFANKVDSIANMNFIEARWVASATSGATSSSPEDDFNTVNRKANASIFLKYDGKQIVKGELRSADRICPIIIPRNELPNANEVAALNRDLILTGMSNRITADNGMSAERSALSYINIYNKNTDKHETLTMMQETKNDSRNRNGDEAVNYKFQSPLSAKETVVAYFAHQDKASLAVFEAMNIPESERASKLTSHNIQKAIEADKIRAFLSASMSLPFQPLVNQNVVNSVPANLQKTTAIGMNTAGGLYKSLTNGDSTVRLVNCTTYALGRHYLQRLQDDVLAAKPISGMFELNQKQTPEGETFMAFTNYTKGKDTNQIIFAPANFDVKRRDLDNNESSEFYVSYVHPEKASRYEVEKMRSFAHTLQDRDAAKEDSFTFVKRDYGNAQTRNAFDILENEAKRIRDLASENEHSAAYEKLYRIVQTPIETAQRTKKEPENEISNSFVYQAAMP